MYTYTLILFFFPYSVLYLVIVSHSLLVLHFPHRIYKYQAHGYAFSSVEELLSSLGGSGFHNMTQRPLSESLLELGVSQRFIDEVIAPIMRVNYGQNVSIPAFVGKIYQVVVLSRTLQKVVCRDVLWSSSSTSQTLTSK